MGAVRQTASPCVAAYRRNRIAYAGEIDPDYFNLGVARLLNLINDHRTIAKEPSAAAP